MKKTIVMIYFLIISFFFINVFAHEFGSKDDPLITLSYINDVLYSDIIKKIDVNISKAISQANNEIELKLQENNQIFTEKKKEIIKSMNEYFKEKNIIDNITNKVNNNKNHWEIINLPIDTSITIFKGSEFFLYSGDVISDNNIINVTKSSIHYSNEKLHIYNSYIAADKINIYTLTNSKILIHGIYYSKQK